MFYLLSKSTYISSSVSLVQNVATLIYVVRLLSKKYVKTAPLLLFSKNDLETVDVLSCFSDQYQISTPASLLQNYRGIIECFVLFLASIKPGVLLFCS